MTVHRYIEILLCHKTAFQPLHGVKLAISNSIQQESHTGNLDMTKKPIVVTIVYVGAFKFKTFLFLP